jgi:hypothetical protein
MRVCGRARDVVEKYCQEASTSSVPFNSGQNPEHLVTSAAQVDDCRVAAEKPDFPAPMLKKYDESIWWN